MCLKPTINCIRDASTCNIRSFIMNEQLKAILKTIMRTKLRRCVKNRCVTLQTGFLKVSTYCIIQLKLILRNCLRYCEQEVYLLYAILV